MSSILTAPTTLMDSPNGYVSSAWRAVLLRDPCVYCGAPAEGLDHIRPRLANGRDGWENRAPACRSCDSAKGGSLLLGFLLGARIAERTVARRRYATPGARQEAQRQIREHIAKHFYAKCWRADNLRWVAR